MPGRSLYFRSSKNISNDIKKVLNDVNNINSKIDNMDINIGSLNSLLDNLNANLLTFQNDTQKYIEQSLNKLTNDFNTNLNDKFNEVSSNFDNVYSLLDEIKGINNATTLYKHFKNLSNIITELTPLFQNYNNGFFTSVIDILTQEYYEYYALELNKLKIDTDSLNYIESPFHIYFETLRSSFAKCFTNLKQSIAIYSQLLDTKKKLESCKEDTAILNDVEKLVEYLNELKKQMGVFKPVTIDVPLFEIKPEYVEYIKLYGVPYNGIFDADKISYILANM